MKTKILLITFFLITISCTAFAQSTPSAIDFEHVTVEYHGSWQWGQDKFHPYTFEELENEDFSFDLGNTDPRTGENWLQIIYVVGSVGNVYRIEAVPLGGSSETTFVIKKNGEECFRQTIDVGIVFNTTINAPACGLNFETEREILNPETDLQLHKITLNGREIAEVKNAFFKLPNAEKLAKFARDIREINNRTGIRLIDLQNANDFQTTGNYLIYSKPTGFNEEDDTLTSRFLVISDGKWLRHIIFIENAIFENLVVYESTDNVDVTTFRSSQDLYNLINDRSKTRKIEGKNAEDYDTLNDWLVGGGTATVATAGTLIAGGGAAIIGTKAALVTTGGVIAKLSAGATAVGTGTFVGISLPIIAGVAVVAGTVGSVYYFTETDSYIYHDILINWDEEFWGRNDKKLNFILFKKSGTTPDDGGVTPAEKSEGMVKISLEGEVRKIRDMFSTKTEPPYNDQSYRSLVQNPIQALAQGITVFKADELGNKISSTPEPVVITSEGQYTVVFSNLKKGQAYVLELQFKSPYPTNLKKLDGAIRVDKVE